MIDLTSTRILNITFANTDFICDSVFANNSDAQRVLFQRFKKTDKSLSKKVEAVFARGTAHSNSC